MRLAVVSPFLDRRHGTERCIVEQIDYFLKNPDWEIHIYSQCVEDLEVVRPGPDLAGAIPGKAIWHRIPTLPGPHLFNYLWWFIANQYLRWYQKSFRSLYFDLIFSPGINGADADAIVVHIVFHEFFRLVREELRFRKAPITGWPILLHRLLYYRLSMALENRFYRRRRVALAAVSKLTAGEITAHFGRADVTVIPNAVDLKRFNAVDRMSRRVSAREKLQIPEEKFVLLLVGNDWKKKGLGTLLKAVSANPDCPFHVLVAGRDDRSPFLSQIRALSLDDKVQFAEHSPDVLQFYAASDVYAGPSLHDSFALPPLEAMACGLPVITTPSNGGSQAISDGVDGFVLQEANDSTALGEILRRLYEQPELRRSVGENAARTAQSYTWDRNARETLAFLTEALRLKEARQNQRKGTSLRDSSETQIHHE